MSKQIRIIIPQSFSLSKIAASGQCFRVRAFDDGTYRFVTGDRALYIRQTGKDNEPISRQREIKEAVARAIIKRRGLK